MYEQVLFDRRTTRRIAARRVTVTVNLGAERVTYGARDLSLLGVQLQGRRPLSIGQALLLDLRHALVESPPSLPARVIWRGLSAGGEPRLGLEFTLVSPEQRGALRRFLAAEAGHTVVRAEGEVAGFLLRVAEGVWTLFDEHAIKAGIVNREGPGRYLLCLPGSDPRASHRYRQVGSLDMALGLVFGLSRAPRIDPPFDDPEPVVRAALSSSEATPIPAAPPPAPPPAAARPGLDREQPPLPIEDRRGSSEQQTPLDDVGAPTAAPSLVESGESGRPVAGHCIRDANRNVLGYAAVTGDQVWSLYDASMEQVGVLSRAGQGYTVFWLGGQAETSSMLSVEAETFPAALAIAYEVDTLPGLSPAVITPSTRTTEVPRAQVTEVPGSRVVFRKQVVGFVCESAMDHAWAVFNRDYEQTALIARAAGPEGRYRVCWMGASAEDSMDFSEHESLLGAVAASFHLPAPPLLDPPLD